jgi:microcompartment protein CcmK/EutM
MKSGLGADARASLEAESAIARFTWRRSERAAVYVTLDVNGNSAPRLGLTGDTARWLVRGHSGTIAGTMQLARVIGTVVSTAKYEGLVGHKLLVLQPLDGRSRDDGRPLVAIDSVGAGVGEVVMWCRGKESSFPFMPRNVPSDATVVGIVDHVNLEGP